ncbi:A-kinase anchor protein 9 [Triplophysa tibetana]|uniref:A-kinase anchor protein 9 n=1 Tax=Triplophysa tibetana TaxID=1572043 RepID=A0A5A9NJE0_9TELE|nr:A-kinase anchor protein 9 [Triplophysa tibetana]
MMEDDERQKKLQAGKAKLAEYRQRKALSDGQKKQKKKKKKVESEEQRRDDEDQTLGEQRGDQTTVFSLSKTLRSGETVTHDQTYTIEPESEMSTTAEDCSSEEDEEAHEEPDHQSGSPAQIMQDELAAKTLAMEELSRELDEIRAAFGTEGVQQVLGSLTFRAVPDSQNETSCLQLQDFEEALKQRDEIITQLTTNLQQARVEKEDVMREFLELTEQSQKLQIQFQQLQTGQILRSSSISSSISSTAADLLQARQQISLHQQQLEERDAQVKGHQEKTQEHLLLISQLQERLDQADGIRSQAEESSSERLQEKDLLNAEQQRLISGHALTLSDLQDQLLTTTQQLDEVNKHLSAKTHELENCERELSASRQKERMSSTEILQLMKTVEDLQQRCHQGSQSEGQTIQRIEGDWTRRMDQLRAELDEMYGQQIAQMKQELRVQHASEMDRMRAQHSEETEEIVLQHRSELERFKGQLSHSTGDVNVLNVRLIELQQKLQESQVLREMAERERTQSNAENIDMVNQMERLHQELQSAIRSKSPERSRAETQLLHDAISDLQSQLDAAQKTVGDLESKHESEITNYKIKLDMLEREKDAVLDRMAESLEAELERLRTQLLFSHEEELSQLRHDLQQESQLNGENLRDEMAVRHRESVELLRMDFEDRLRSAEDERAALAAERGTLLQDISVLKSDLNRALESSRAEELVIQLRELQTEAENLKRRGKTKEEDWERMESENKILKETNTAMRDELMLLKEDREVLLQKTQHLSLENEQTHMRLKDLLNEIEKQRNTFSFAEKNFEVNYQELKDEYTCLVNAKVQLEERLIKETMDYETKLGELRTKNKSEDDEVLVEKDATELMEKLEMSEREKKILTQRLSESVAQVTLMEADIKRLKEELKRDRGETAEDCGVAGGPRSLEAHHAHIRCLEEKTETSAEQDHGSDLQCLRVLTQENSAPVKWPGVNRDPSSQAGAAAQQSEGGERETHASTTAEAPAERTHAAAQQQSESGERGAHASYTAEALAERTHAAAAAHEDVLTEPNGRRPQQDECRLQLEAQRISLSQIHAAQLELLRESLHAQTEAQLRSRDQELQDAHERELRCLQEEMRSEQQEVREFLERHRQETERLKIYYHQQMEEIQERCTADILLLKRRLQELTGTQELFSMPSVSAPLTTEKPCEDDQDEESLSTEGLSRELQAVQEAQSESERQVKHHQELLEEEIAKAIVQMSVEFAQHTEHTRLGKKAREMSTSTQTLNAEDLRLTDPDAVTMTTSQQDTQREQELMGETQRDDLMHPSMQSSSTQTEQKNNEDEETKSRGREEPVTSQQAAPKLSSDVIVTERFDRNERFVRERYVTYECGLPQLKVNYAETLSSDQSQWSIPGSFLKRRYIDELITDEWTRCFVYCWDASSETAAEDASVFTGELEEEEGLERSLGAELQLQEAEFELEREEHLMSISTRLQNAVKKLFITITETSTEDGWMDSQDQDIYEVESRIPLPRPFPLTHVLHEKNAVVVQTKISHINHRTDGHLLKVISKISLPTPPYTLMREKFRHNEEMEELVIRQEELQERLRVEARGLIDGYTGERLALEQQGRERADLQLHLEQELRVTSNRLHELEHERQQIQQERELLSRQQDAMREGAGSRELHLLEETEKLMAEKVEVQRQAQKESGELLLQVKQLEAELEEQVNRVQELEETRGTEAADLAQQILALEKQLEKNRKFMDEQAADREHERDVFQQEIQNLEQQLKNPQKTQTGSERREREAEEVQHVSMAGSGVDVTLEEQLQTEKEALDRKEKEIMNLEEQLEQFREELENKSEEVLEEKDGQIAVLNAQISKLQHTGTDTHNEAVQEKNDVIRELESQLEHLGSEQERLKRNNEEEMDQLNAVIEKLQQELLNIEHKQPHEEETYVGKEDYNEMKQKMDEVTKELDTLKSHQRSLLSKYEDLQEEALAGRHAETVAALQEALEQKTAAFVVGQAQVQALEESASSKVMDLRQRVEELEMCVEEKDSELRVCRIKVEKAQSDAEALFCKVAQLEEKLREKVAAVLVAQAQLGAVQTQSKELHDEAQDVSTKLCGTRTQLGPRMKVQSKDTQSLSEGPSVQLESEGPKTQSEDPEGQSEGPSVQLKSQSEGPSVQFKSQSEGPSVQLKSQSEGPSVQLESEGPKTQSEDPTAHSEGPSVQLESEGPKTHSEDPKAQSEGTSVQPESEGPKKMSEDPKAQSEGPSVQLKSEDPKKQSEGPKAQSEGPSVQLKSEGPKTQSEDPKGKSKDPSVVQLKSEGPKTQSEGTSVQPESEGPKKMSEDPKAQSEGPSVQLKSEDPKKQSEGPKAQSEGPSVQLKSEGPKTQSEDPKGKSKDPSVVQLKSEGPKTQSEGPSVQLESESPKTQAEGPMMQVESDGSGVKLDSEGLRAAAVASSPADKVSLLTEKLKELEEDLSGMQKDQELQKQLLCSSEEEVQEYERRLALLMDLLNQMRTKASRHRPDSSDEVTGSNQSVTEILQQLQEVKGEAASTKEELKCYRELSHKLQEDTEMKESTITQLQTALTQVYSQTSPHMCVTDTTLHLYSHDERMSHSVCLPQMSVGTGEKDSAEAEKLLQEVKGQLSITQQELETFRDQSVRLQELLQTSREEDGSTSELLQELQEVKDEAASTKEELNNHRECSLKLQEQIEVHNNKLFSMNYIFLPCSDVTLMSQVRDVSIAQLKEEVQELRTLTEAIDEMPSQPKNKHEDNREHHGKNITGDSSKDTPPFSHEISSDQSELSTSCSSLNGTHVPSRVDAETQADLSGAVDVEEMITGYTEKIGQMQELHAAEIMDMEARHISESETLKTERQELEERCGALRDALQKLRSAEGPSVRSERPSVSPFKEGYTSDSSSEWGQRTGCDLPQPHQELRTTPEGARRDVEPDLLPDRIKSLLREVHQEGMQVLSLSEAERSGEQQLHHQTWSVERDALINSIQSLIEVISQIQRDTQVFVRERDVLKNFLHSHVERLDSTDDVIHLNQMLREITEQDVRHRDVMGLLCSADRNSLITEIHQLRAQRRPVDTSAGHTERETEELQTELKQTQLDLESSLKSQHRLMKDLDTVRAEVSLKTAELNTLNDTLASEQKRVRELQWLYEKDKCKADRKQEAEREEVEDLKLMLEEQRARVSELSSALERETQMTRDQTDGAPVCEVSVSSELQGGVLSVESLLQTLQSQLAEKQTQVVQLMEQMEKQKLDELQRRRQFEEEKSSMTRSAAQDQSELRAAHDSTARLERQTDDLRMQLDAERDDLQRLERERDGLQERVRQLEEKLRLVENKESVRSDGQSADRTLDWVLQQKTSETQDSSTPSGANQSSDPKHVNNILNRLQLIAAKITSLTSDTSDRLSVEPADRDSLTWLHNNVQDVMSLLQHIPSAPSALPEVSLRSSAERHESERDAWIHERGRLEKSLRRAEAELSRVRADVRSDALRDLTGPDVDSSALKKIYSKYLRAESFRKALIYQKKYLLLLLGGFQECEEATLSLIARMGGHPTHTCPESLGHRRRGFTRFRSAVRVSIALSRMKFLAKRWQRAAGGVLTSQMISRNGQMTGGVDVFRERRAGSRGRTGRESPRSAASITHRYHSMAVDSGGLSCSHLQNYDPDRALTDYISRLEALQRRLGSVQSGSNAQMHFGVRR